LKISILIPNLSGGGAERVAVNLANSFVKRGYLVDMVLMSAKVGEFQSDLSPQVQVVDLNAKRLRGTLLPLFRYFRQAKPDAILANMWPMTLIAIWARKLAQIKTRLVVAEHTTWSKDVIARSWLGRRKVSLSMHHIYPHADAIVSVSKGAADDLAQFADLDAKAISVIYNPVVGGEIQPSSVSLEPERWWTGSHYRILAVGSLSPIKDYDLLMVAFANLRQRFDARLLILGEGFCRSSLIEKARQLGILDSLFMPGFIKTPWPYYLRADLHVLSSKGEGFGNVIVEALSAGTPVVSTDCKSGPREILSDGKYGRLVPTGDPVALTAAMAESLSENHDKDALRARAKYFSIEKAAEQYILLLFPNHGT
jgi:glycosyltransferase involved in cell wall biosynthesis